MTILLLLIPLSLLLLGAAVWAFAWAVRRGQFDDLDTPALDILCDDDDPADDAIRDHPDAD
jgi:cbb3-type cytochrome oxidase maturation protein